MDLRGGYIYRRKSATESARERARECDERGKNNSNDKCTATQQQFQLTSVAFIQLEIYFAEDIAIAWYS